LEDNPIVVFEGIPYDGFHGFQRRKSLSFWKVDHIGGIGFHGYGVFYLLPNFYGKGIHISGDFGIGL
jgi:hypothetical protein